MIGKNKDLIIRKRNIIIEYFILSVLLLLISLSSSYNYLLFHVIAELSVITISIGIFVVGWNSRGYIKESFFLIIGVSFLFIGIIDLLHTLAYAGMNIFIGYTSNLPTSLWIVARFWQAISLIIALFFLNKSLNLYYLIFLSTISLIILLGLIFLGIFPLCYIEGFGLTPFKIISEYIIDILLVISFIWIYFLRKEFDRRVFMYIIVSIITTIISELAFTFYISVYDFSNLVGHLLKIIAFYHMYKAIIQTGIKEPYNLLFRKISLSEEELKKKAAQLENINVDFSQIFKASLPLRIIDKNCNIIRANDTYINMFEIKREEVIGKKCYDFFPSKYCFSEKCSMKQILSGKEDYEYVSEIFITGNVNKIFIVHSVPYLNVNGDFLGLIQNFADITGQHEIQRKLKISEYRYRTTFEQSPDGIIILDPETSLPYEFNNSICEMLSYSREEFSKLKVNEYDVLESEDDTREHIDLILENKSDKFETQFRTKSGEIKDISVLTKLVEFSGKKYIQSICRDITEEKRAEEKVEDMARLALENPNPVLRVDKKCVISANKASKELFEIEEDSIIPKILQQYIDQCFNFKKNLEIELNIDHEIYTFFFIFNEEKAYVNIYGLNITERIKAKQRLERFVSTVSHELRTPISVLVTSSDFLDNYSNDVTDEIIQKLKEGMKKNIYLLKDLVDDILMLSRIDDRRITLEWKDIKPFDIIQEILLLMEPIGNKKNISFKLNIDPNLTLCADAKRLDQVFRIFIDNAIKYSARNSNVKISAMDSYRGKLNKQNIDGVLFIFEDTGIGIAEEDLPFLFERFFRSSKVSDIPGTGLGLSIAKELIELHGGLVDVESEFMKGTKFFAFIPRIKRL
jgi:PAS domain S-box-containing protein